MLDLIAPRHAHLSTTTKASFDKTSFILSSPCQGLNDRESRVHCFLEGLRNRLMGGRRNGWRYGFKVVITFQTNMPSAY